MTEKEFDRVPVSYTRSMAWMKFFFGKALNVAIETNLIKEGERNELEKEVQMITWHSMRVTMLSAAVHSGVDDKAIGLQANWKDPGPMVLKYARKRKDLSISMVKNLAIELRRVDARSKRIWCRRPGRSGRARHDRVRSKEQHVSDQDFGC